MLGTAARYSLLLLCFYGLLGTPTPVAAQRPSEAYPGQPFGVARVSLPLTPADLRIWETDGFRLSDSQQRTFYPVFTAGPLTRGLGDLSAQPTGPGNRFDALFLFQGDEPLEVVIETAVAHRVTIVPEQPKRRLQPTRLRNQWWREFARSVYRQEQESLYPPVLGTYLTEMLSHRLETQPLLIQRLAQEQEGELKATLQLLFGVEQLRSDLMHQAWNDPASYTSETSIPLPEEIPWRPLEEVIGLPDPDASLPEMEAMAGHVPPECLYLRFGSWNNQVWLKRFSENQGEQLSQLISLRSYDNRIADRLQQQMAVQDSRFVDLIGGNLIEDVAVIGLDAFVREGAAMGVVLQERSRLLGRGIERQRQALQTAWQAEGAELKTVEIAGQEVSFLTTPDHRLRSFYASADGFHLMTNSRTLMRRFLEVAQEGGGLDETWEFRQARREFPLSRNDSVFIYLSSAFFRGLLTPEYQIEMQRRLQATCDIELLMLARAAGQAEGLSSLEPADLVAGGLLPTGFGPRPDGSHPVLWQDEWVDSLRGRRGFYVPIADMRVTEITPSELAMYQERARFFAEQWPQLDPLIVALKRPESGFGEVAFEAQLQPFGEDKYGWLLGMLGPPLASVVRGPADEMVSIQASVNGGLLFPNVPPHQLFLTLNDDAPLPLESPSGLLGSMDLLRTAPAYLGAWPKPGFLDILPFGLGGIPDARGFTHSLLGVHRWQGDGFSVLSMDEARLEQVSGQLRIEPLDEPAQILVEVGPLGASALRPWLDDVIYWRAREGTIGNVRLANQLSLQLRIPPDQSLDFAQSLLDVEFVCPLRGEYEVVQPPGLTPRVRSSVLDPNLGEPQTAIPSEAIDLLAGAQLRLVTEPGRFRAWGKLGIRDSATDQESSQ